MEVRKGAKCCIIAGILFLISEDEIKWTSGRIWLVRNMGAFHNDRKESRTNGKRYRKVSNWGSWKFTDID